MSASSLHLAPLTPAGHEETWSALAAVVVTLAVSEPRPDLDSYEVLTLIERPRGGERR